MSTVDQNIAATRHLVYAADALSIAAIIGAFLSWLPPLAALAAAIWYAVQIWESKTIQGWVRQRRQRKRSLTRLKRVTYTKRREWEKHEHGNPPKI